jgi:hypothetical protein
MVPTDRQREVLRRHAIRPGEVRNPEGRNQWHYRREYERRVRELLAAELDAEALEALALPPALGRLLPARPTFQDWLALRTVYHAARGDERALAEANARLWPRTDRHELVGAEGDAMRLSLAAPAIDVASLPPDLREELGALARRIATVIPPGALAAAAGPARDSIPAPRG